MLCGLLAATGVAGRPDSHFHAPSVDRWFASHAVDPARHATPQGALRAVVEAARRRGTDDTGIFGLRVQRDSFDHLVETLGELHPGARSDRARIEAAFGPTLFVHLTRSDRLGQAISHVRAAQTGLWHRNADGSELERTAPERPARYDPDAIARNVAAAVARDAAWTAWFGREGIEPLRVVYEDLTADPRGATARILAALERDPERAAGVAVPTARLADAVSADWRARFEAEGHALRGRRHLRASP